MKIEKPEIKEIDGVCTAVVTMQVLEAGDGSKDAVLCERKITISTPTENKDYLLHLISCAQHTPENYWEMTGVDNAEHVLRYSKARSTTTMGSMDDFSLANKLYMCNHRTSFSSIGLLTAGRDRIRFLSRALTEMMEAVTKSKVKDYHAVTVARQIANRIKN